MATLGIVGGLGPESTVDYYRLLGIPHFTDDQVLIAAAKACLKNPQRKAA